MSNKAKFYLISPSDKDLLTKIVESDNHPMNKRNHGLFSCSVGYDSIKELNIDNGILEKPCVVCGSLVKTLWMPPYDKLTNDKCTCLSCLIWEENILAYNKGEKTVIDGYMYVISPDNPDAYFKGSGGRKYIIKYNDSDKEVISHNVWHNGSIPTRFLDKLPDNAIFIN